MIVMSMANFCCFCVIPSLKHYEIPWTGHPHPDFNDSAICRCHCSQSEVPKSAENQTFTYPKNRNKTKKNQQRSIASPVFGLDIENKSI